MASAETAVAEAAPIARLFNEYPWVRRAKGINAKPEIVTEFHEVKLDLEFLDTPLGKGVMPGVTRGLWLKLRNANPSITKVFDGDEKRDKQRQPISVSTAGPILNVVSAATFKEHRKTPIGEILLDACQQADLTEAECMIITWASTPGEVIAIAVATVDTRGLPAILAEWQAQRGRS